MTWALSTTDPVNAPQINDTATPGQAVQMLRVWITANQGDLIEADFTQEVTSDEDYQNALAWVEFFVSKDWHDTKAPTRKNELCSQGGTNITPEQHHYTFSRSGKCLAPVTGSQYVIAAITWDPDLSQPGKIEQGAGYGKMNVVVTPKT